MKQKKITTIKQLVELLNLVKTQENEGAAHAVIYDDGSGHITAGYEADSGHSRYQEGFVDARNLSFSVGKIVLSEDA